MYSLSRFIRVRISCRGRFQFSVEKAYSVTVGNAQSSDRFDGFPHRADPGPVPLDARQVARAGPATIAVHDDGEMAGQSIEIEKLQDLPFLGPWRSDLI